MAITTGMDKKTPISAPSQHAELVSILGVIASQIQSAMQETDAPASVLVETAHSLAQAAQTVASCLSDCSTSPAGVVKDLTGLQADLQSRAAQAATAIQFHDRLVQRLTHVCSNLNHLAEFMTADDQGKTPGDWAALRERVRSTHSMEAERTLFDRLNRAGSPEEQQQAVEESRGAAAGENKVELF